jgi:hypothetical protein
MASQPNSFTNEKVLRFVITLGIGRGSFGGGNQTLMLEGLRASANIDNAGGNMMSTLRANIYGMTASDMNAATTTQWDPLTLSAPNTIEVWAIDGKQETLVFSGNIINAWGIYAGMPEVFLMIQAQNNYGNQMNPADRYTLAANTTIAQVMQSLASKMGMQFENNGVIGIVKAGTSLSGSYIAQAQQMRQAYRFWMYFDPASNTLAISPANTGRNGPAPVPLIYPQSGLEGYPVFNGVGVQFDTLFNPQLQFGGSVKIQSSIQKANGSWVVVSMSHTLESQTPGGQWKSTVSAVYPSVAGTTLPGVSQ